MKTLDSFLLELRQQGVTLRLEDDRLRYRSPEGAMSAEILSELKARKSEILTFLQQVTTEAHRPPLVPLERQGLPALSFAQRRFWLLHQFEPNSSAHNMPVVLRLSGKLDIPALEQSLKEIGRRHEILRTTFPAIDGEPRQQISPELEITLRSVDLRSIPAEQRQAEALRLSTAAAQQPFNLETGPMLHVSLLQLAEQDYLFLWVIHCITGDGSSSDIFYQELTTLYAAFAAGQPSPLPELPLQYADFAEWQRNWLQGAVLEQQLEYWKQRLGGNLSAVQLPTDHPRPPVQTFRGDRCPRMFSPALHGNLVKLSQQTGTTLFMVLLAAFKTLLFRYSGQEDLLISFTNAGRDQVETERLIGFFSGTLLLRTSFAGNPSFRELLRQVREELLEAYAHQDLPFEKLVEELRPEQNQSRSPLFQIKFALNPPWTNGRGMSAVQLPELTLESLFGYIYHGETKFDLILVMREQEQGLGAVFDYNADLFDLSTAERMMDHFQSLLEAIIANPDQQVLALPLLAPAEQQQLAAWNNTAADYPKQLSIDQLFAAQVRLAPDAIALLTAEQQMTYQELDARANRLGQHLQAQGVAPNTTIGICLERSMEAVVALLAVLKAGSTYLPLDPSADPDHLAVALEDAAAAAVLTEPSVAGKLPHAVKVIALGMHLDLDSVEPTRLKPPICETTERPAYLLYHHDSNRPLQQRVSHRAVVHLATGGGYADITPAARFLQHSLLCQPASAFEIWASLLNGACLVLAPVHPLQVEQLGELIQLHRVTSLWLPTRLLHRLVDQQLANLKSVQQFFTGGDVLSVQHVQQLQQEYPAATITQVYLSLGSAAFTCFYPIPPLTALKTAIPIGRPLANTTAYVLNSQGQAVPMGVPGELCIGGDSVDMGQPEPGRAIGGLMSPIHPQMPLYKTGDLARLLPEGTLERIGRVDQLAKLHWRAELGRIETLLSQHPAIGESLVRVHPEDACIVAYLVFKPNQSASATELRSYLRQDLPWMMLPSWFVALEAIPLTPVGEVDSTLPLPNSANQLPDDALGRISSNLENQLLQIWQTLFGVQTIAVQDNFFELGGDSLLAVRMFSQIEQIFNKRLPLSVLLNAPTVEQLAEFLQQDDSADLWSPLVEIQAGDPERLPLFCIHGMGFNVLVYRALAANLPPDQPVYGLQARGLDGKKDRIVDRLESIAADYIKEIQTIQAQGPYLLAGLSNGGNIALEMAQQLRSQGQEVALVGMFDTFGPNSVTLLPTVPKFISSLGYVLRFSLPHLVQQARFSDIKQLPIKLQRLLNQLPAPAVPSQLAQRLVNPKAFAPTHTIQQWMDQFSQYVVDRSSWSFLPQHLLKEAGGSLSQAIEDLEGVHRELQSAYAPSLYPGEITLFRASESPPGYYVDPWMGWSEIARAGVRVYKIPGNHTSMMESPALAVALRECIDQIQTTHLSWKNRHAE